MVSKKSSFSIRLPEHFQSVVPTTYCFPLVEVVRGEVSDSKISLAFGEGRWLKVIIEIRSVDHSPKGPCPFPDWLVGWLVGSARGGNPLDKQ